MCQPVKLFPNLASSWIANEIVILLDFGVISPLHNGGLTFGGVQDVLQTTTAPFILPSSHSLAFRGRFPGCFHLQKYWREFCRFRSPVSHYHHYQSPPVCRTSWSHAVARTPLVSCEGLEALAHTFGPSKGVSRFPALRLCESPTSGVYLMTRCSA